MCNSRLILRVKGGLGNQLFCYAAARRLAMTNDAELVIDDVTGFARDRRYQRRYALDRFRIPARRATWRERMEPFGRFRRAMMKMLARRRPFDCRRYLECDGVAFDPRLLQRTVEGTVYLDGYWQSENYFKDVDETIRDDLQIVPPPDAVNQRMAQRIGSCNAVAVHVRWFETRTVASKAHNVGPTYYSRALQEIRNRVASAHFFVFSDDPEPAREMLALPEGEATCVSHNKGDESAYADLWLMTQCKHFIIANSTFSWWGAWLSPYVQKVVVAPGIVQSGISSWGFEGLLPAEWIQV